MIRHCFLCHGEIEVLQRARWDLPGLPARDLGFGVCAGCGMVLQSPAVEPAEMRRWYEASAVYTSPGRGGRPHPRKVRGTTRLVRMVEHALGALPSSAFQVGSSDGYTLARFREAGVARVMGLDPSAASCELAHARNGVETQVGAIEETAELPEAELWILAHVLEHLYDPLAVLRRARAAAKAPWLAVEVPLFEREDLFPTGYLAFEHVNYFTEESLVRTLARAGYEVTGIAKEFADDIYPILAAMARPCESRGAERGDGSFAAEERGAALQPGERERARERLAAFLAREDLAWRRVREHLARELVPGARVWLWGAGVFASQVLANTGLAARVAIAGILDSSEQKRGTPLGDHRVHARRDVDLGPRDSVVITSFASAQEIWSALAPERERGVHVVRLDLAP